jgi:hypothetical protein
MKKVLLSIVLLVAGCAFAQESRGQFSVRVAAEESASAPQTAKQTKQPKQSSEKQAAQSWPKQEHKPSAKKATRNSSQGWWGKSGK